MSMNTKILTKSHCPVVKSRSFSGCVQHVARNFLELQPRRLLVISRQLLHLLRAHEAAAAFQAAAEKLVRAHLPDQSEAMPTPPASVLIGDCCSSLAQLANLLAEPLPTSASSASMVSMPTTVEPLGSLLEAIRCRRLIGLLAALLGVSSAHRATLELQLSAGASAEQKHQLQQQAVLVEAAFQQQLAIGAKQLLAVLCSSSAGRRLILDDVDVVEQLLLATNADCLATDPLQPAVAAEGAVWLQHFVVAEAVTVQLTNSSLESESFAVASGTAVALLHEWGAAARQALAQALVLRSPTVVPRLLDMLNCHCALLRTAASRPMDSSTAGPDFAAAVLEPALAFELLLALAPACAPAGQLLLEIVAGSHAGSLAGFLQHAAPDIEAAATEQLRLFATLPLEAAVSVAGLGGARSQLYSIKGALAAAQWPQRQGADGLQTVLGLLRAEMPSLQDGEDARCASVAWTSVEELFW